MSTWQRILAAVLALSLSHSAQAIIMHDAAMNDPAWQQEYKDLGQQYNSVVAFYGYDGSHWWNAGSGVVISDHHVLGAAHVAEYSDYWIVEGNDIVSDAWASFSTTDVTVNPLYTGIGSTDLAIWTFAETITSDKVTPAKLYTGNDSALLGSLGDLSGFGWYGYPSTGPVALDGAKRGCQDVISMLGYPPFGFGTDQFVMSFDQPGSPHYQHLGGSTAAIDSGGGWFVAGAPEPTLYAINDWVTASSYSITGATSVSQHLDWINSVIGVPEPSTVVLLFTATACLSFRRRRAL